MIAGTAQALTLENGQERQAVLDKFVAFFHGVEMPVLEPLPQTEAMIKQFAITKDIRQKTLDKFFSAGFGHVSRWGGGLKIGRGAETYFSYPSFPPFAYILPSAFFYYVVKGKFEILLTGRMNIASDSM